MLLRIYLYILYYDIINLVEKDIVQVLIQWYEACQAPLSMEFSM